MPGDIGFGEIVAIVVIALLVFGPDRLPKMAADAGRMLRQVRQMAANARADLVDAAGLENDPELSQTMRDLRDLDPRRGLSGILADEPTRSRKAQGGAGAGEGIASARPGGAAGAVAPEAAPGASASDADAAGSAGSQGSAPSGASGAGPSRPAGPTAPPVVAPAPAVDPDWT